MDAPKRPTHQILETGGPAALVNAAADAVSSELKRLVEFGRLPLVPGDVEWLCSEIRAVAFREAGRVSRGSADWGQEIERRRATTTDVTKAYFLAVQDANIAPAGSLSPPSVDQVTARLAKSGVRIVRDDVLAQLTRLGMPIAS